VGRQVVDGAECDQEFTGNLAWESTDYLKRHVLGYGLGELVEITKAEADSFVERIIGPSRNQNDM
jgi:hypothetical protein